LFLSQFLLNLYMFDYKLSNSPACILWECDLSVEILFFTIIFVYLGNNCVFLKEKLPGQNSIAKA